MRRSIVVVVLLVAACATGLTGRSALAQVNDQSLSPAQQIVTNYLLTPSQIPSGLKQADIMPLDNVAVAAGAEDPTDVQKVIARARIDGLEQDFNKTASATTQIELQVSLFRDSTGARADVADPTLLAEFPLTPVSIPSFGDVSAGYTSSLGGLELTNILFSEDRLEVLVTELGTTGGTSVADITPLSRLIESKAKTPPPAPTPAELAVLQTQTSPESILYDAYEELLQNYLTQLQPSDLLTAAYNGASTALTAAGVASVPPAPSITSTDQDGAWTQFLPAYQALEAEAPSSIAPRDLAYDAATQLYSNLNCHTTFMKPTDYANFIDDSKGVSRARIGITLQKFPDGSYAILRVEPNSPAQQAGLLAGDVVQAVDGKTPAAEGDQFTAQFIGPAGSPLTLTLMRPGTDQPFDLTIVRQEIQPVIEEDQILPGGIGSIELDEFTDGDQSYTLVKQALQKFAAAGNVNSWILDLRYNGGGSALTLAKVAGLFVPAGSLLVTETAQDGTVSTDVSLGAPVPDQKSMVLLVGGGTASAAEIFAQSLKDLGRVTLVGEKTAGCVNGGMPLGLLDTSGVFVSTIAVGAGPNKVALENAGITPDVPVSQSLTDLQQGLDPILNEAIALFGGPVPTAQPAAPSSQVLSQVLRSPGGPLWRSPSADPLIAPHRSNLVALRRASAAGLYQRMAGQGSITPG